MIIDITEGERRKLLGWAKKDYNHFERTGGGAVKTYENKLTLIDKLKKKSLTE